MEVQWDSAAGQASIVRGGSGPEPIQAEPESGLGTIDERTEFIFDNAGRGLADRARLAESTRGISDEDLDRGSFDASLADLELSLQEIQLKQHRAQSPVEQARWAAKAEKVAARLIAGNQQIPDKAKESEPKEELTVEQELKESGVDIEASLANAGEVLSDDSMQAWNELLGSKERGDQIMAAKMMQNLRTDPSMFETDLSKYVAMDDALAAEIAASYGADIAKDLQLLSISIKEGVCTPAEAYRLHQRNDRMAAAVNQLMRAGKVIMPI